MKEKVSENAVRGEVFVFKTSLSTSVEMLYLDDILSRIHGIEEWSLDLDDWEKVFKDSFQEHKCRRSHGAAEKIRYSK